MRPSEEGERVAKFYDRVAKDRPDAPNTERMWYGQPEGQTARFESFLALTNPRGKVLLDVGCGDSELLAFLWERGAMPREYMGIDVSEEMIGLETRRAQEAAMANRMPLNRFKVDFMDPEFGFEADVICAIGVVEDWFGVPRESRPGTGLHGAPARIRHREHIEAFIQKAVAQAREAVYLTFLSEEKQVKYETDLLTNPVAWPSWLRTQFRWVRVDWAVAQHVYGVAICTREPAFQAKLRATWTDRRDKTKYLETSAEG